MMRRYHPVLPAAGEAATDADYTDVTSDHVPVLAKFEDFYHNHNRTVLSWNVGVHNEIPEKRANRHQRIANSLAYFVENFEPDFITLQEVSIDTPNGIFDIIKPLLEKHGYQCLASGTNSDTLTKHANVTFHRKDKFSHITTKNIPSPFAAIDSTFTNIATNRKIRIANANSRFNHMPFAHEENIENYLSQTDAETTSIVVGSFNCHIAPVGDKPSNITTSVTPISLQDSKCQGAAATDGCFYATGGYKHLMTHHQAEITHLDPSTGLALNDSETRAVDTAVLTPSQKQEVSRLRMQICVDKYFKDLCLEKEHEEITIPNYRVRLATNLNNSFGYSVILEKDWHEYIKAHFTNTNVEMNGITFTEIYDLYSSEACPVIFIEQDSYSDFRVMLNKLTARLPCKALFDQCQLMNQDTHIDTEVKAAYQLLYKNLMDDSVNFANPAYAIIANHFTEEAKRTLVKPKRDFSEIQAAAAKLDANLLGKRPNALVRTAACAVIGTLLGATVGFVVGAVATSWGGGFGALPAAILGASAGVTLLTTTKIAIAGAGLAAMYGLFSSRRRSLEYGVRTYRMHMLEESIIPTKLTVKTA
jgi:exonuclease III